MEGEEDEEIIKKGTFDNGIDYEPTRDKLIAKYIELSAQIELMDEDIKGYVNKRRILMHKLIYLLIAMIQLRNGSRIIEACKAFKIFINHPEYIDQDKRVTVKIAKSESLKRKKNGEEFITEPRFRKMIFPKKWIELKYADNLKFYTKPIINKLLKVRVYDYLRANFQCNTHSLRYAFINYMLYKKNRPISDVCKFIGHSNANQIVRYTQQKNSDQIFDLDM